VRPTGGRVGKLRSENRTPDGLSKGLPGGDLIGRGSSDCGAPYIGLIGCVGEGGVYTPLLAFGPGEDEEFEVLDGSLCIGGALGCSSTLPDCFKCSTTGDKADQHMERLRGVTQ
jgi:hypothetical protein